MRLLQFHTSANSWQQCSSLLKRSEVGVIFERKTSYGKIKHLNDAINLNKVEQLIFRTFNNQSIDEQVVYEERKC